MAVQSRLTISLPTPIYDDLVHISDRMNISRSAVLASILEEALSNMRRFVDCVPSDPSSYSVQRFRGDSREIIRERLQALMDDLDKDATC